MTQTAQRIRLWEINSTAAWRVRGQTLGCTSVQAFAVVCYRIQRSAASPSMTARKVGDNLAL